MSSLALTDPDPDPVRDGYDAGPSDTDPYPGHRPTGPRRPSPDTALPPRALVELSRAFTGLVDMASMPTVPDTAPCRVPGKDPNDWFDPLLSLDLVHIQPRFMAEVAAMLCEGCPVLIECGEWGLANPAQEGILGGMTHKQRLALRRTVRDAQRPLR